MRLHQQLCYGCSAVQVLLRQDTLRPCCRILGTHNRTHSHKYTTSATCKRTRCTHLQRKAHCCCQVNCRICISFHRCVHVCVCVSFSVCGFFLRLFEYLGGTQRLSLSFSPSRSLCRSLCGKACTIAIRNRFRCAVTA